MKLADCPLCQATAEEVLWQDAFVRVVRVDDADHPGFLRVILQDHQREMSALTPAARERLMRAVWAVEAVQLEVLQPDKINLASLGNVVPHLHWHVIPRWRGDRRFPDPIWAPPRRAGGPAVIDAAGQSLDAELQRRGAALASRVAAALDAGPADLR